MFHNLTTTPGAYMRQCRKRAGKSIKDCADEIALAHHDRLYASHDIQQLEANKPGDYSRLVQQLKERAVFPFDIGTFASLARATADESVDEWAAA